MADIEDKSVVAPYHFFKGQILTDKNTDIRFEGVETQYFEAGGPAKTKTN